MSTSNSKSRISLSQLQAEHREWMNRNFGTDVAPYRPLLGAVEEIGELAHAHLKQRDGIRGTAEDHEAAAKDAVGDIIIFLCGYCSTRGFDIQECVDSAWEEVSKRDWT